MLGAGKGAHRRGATSTQAAQQSSLGAHDASQSFAFQGREQPQRLCIILAALNRQSPLSRCGQNLIECEPLGDRTLKAQPKQPGRCHHGCIVFNFPNLAHPGVDIAPNRLDAKIRPKGQDLGGATVARGADRASRFQIIEHSSVARYQYVARIFVQMVENVTPEDNEPSFEAEEFDLEARAKDVDTAIYRLDEALFKHLMDAFPA